MKILVATSLKETYGKEGEILFAGDWVKSSLSFENDLKKRQYKFFETIWKEEKDIKAFASYINKLRDKLISKLASDLNIIHRTNHSLRFWKIIINPWLHYYLEHMYTRFETINKIVNKKENLNFVYLNSLKYFEVPFDVRDFTDYIRTSDIYNQFVFQKIINYFVDIKQCEHLKLIYSDEKITRRENLDFLKRSKRRNYVRRFLSFLLKNLTKNNKFFFDFGFVNFNFITLNLKLKQIPFKDCEFFFPSKDYYELFDNRSVPNPELRKKIFFEFNKENDYENFLSKNFSEDIPTFLIEDFPAIQNCVKKIPYKPKIIVSDVRHWHDTFFKFWTANIIENGSKLVTTDHGGAYGEEFYSYFHQQDIADAFISWYKSTNNKTFQLPVIAPINKKRKKRNEERKFLLTIGEDTTKYPKLIFLGPISGQILYHVEHLSSFYENLNSELKNNFLFKPYPGDNGWNIGKRLEQVFQKKKIIISAKKYWHYFKRSKVIVCTYPKTAFCEAMITGPTILLYKSKYDVKNEEFKSLHENMRKAKILFEDPILASKHLNEIWENVDDWWENEETKKARENFFKEAALVESNPLEKWKKFLYNL